MESEGGVVRGLRVDPRKRFCRTFWGVNYLLRGVKPPGPPPPSNTALHVGHTSIRNTKLSYLTVPGKFVLRRIVKYFDVKCSIVLKSANLAQYVTPQTDEF